jgi:citrate lyase subunit beta/citryl-CoA lyase
MPYISGQLVRRTLLFVPITTDRFVAKAYTRGADCILLDLEDSIPPWDKEKARLLVKKTIPVVGKGGAEIFVRINHPMELAKKDIEAIVWPGIDGFMYPKASRDEIRELDALTEKYERMRGITPRSLEIIPLIETAWGILHAYDVATSSTRIKAMAGGVGLDTSLEIGCEPGPDIPHGITMVQGVWSSVRELLILACTAAKVQPMGLGGLTRLADGTVIAPVAGGYRDSEGQYRNAILARQMGFKGTTTVHPATIEPLNKGFTPTSAEIEWAHKGLIAFNEGLQQNMASIAFEGRMFDIPAALRARQLIARAEAIAQWDAMKGGAMTNVVENEATLRNNVQRAEPLSAEFTSRSL